MTTARSWGGLLDSLRAVLGTGVDLLHTRIELVGVELELELWRALKLLIQAVTALLLACLATGFIGLALIVAFWDSHRTLVAALVAGFFTVLAIIAAVALKRALAARPQPFQSTLQALQRDRDALRSRP